MDRDDTQNIDTPEEGGNEEIKKKKSLSRRIANLFLYSFITFVTMFLLLIIGVHSLLKYYPEQIVGTAIKQSVYRGSKERYIIDYNKIDVKLISGWSIHEFLSSGSISLENVNFHADSLFKAQNDSIPLAQKENLIDVQARTISLQNFSILSALFEKEIYIGNIFIDSANVDIHKYKSKNKGVNSAKKSLTEILTPLFNKNKENLKRYRIGNIHTVNSSLNYFDHTQKIKQQVVLKDIASTINDVYLDSITLKEQLILPLHIGNLELNTSDIRLELKDAPLGLSFRKVSFSTLDSSLLIFNTSLYKINDDIEGQNIPLSNATIPLLAIEGIDINHFLYDSILTIKQLSIVKPEVELSIQKNTSSKKKVKKKTPHLPKFLKGINIGKFSLESATIPFEAPSTGKRRINDISINLSKINIDNTTLKQKIPLDFSYFDVKLKYQRWNLNNKHYAKVGGLYFNSKWKKLYLYAPAYRPKKPVEDSTSQTFVDVTAKKIIIDRIDYNFFLKSPLDSLWAYDDLIIDGLKSEIWLPTHPIAKEKEETKKQKKQNLFVAINTTKLEKGSFKLHIPKKHKYEDDLTVQDINIEVDTLFLPINQPKDFGITNAKLTLGDIKVPKIGEYDILLEQLKFNASDSALALNGINISTDLEERNTTDVESYIKNIQIDDLGWRHYIYSDSLIAERVFIDIPSSDITLPVKDAIKKVNTFSKDSLQKKKPKGKLPFKYLLVQDFHLRKGPLTLTKEGQGLLARSEHMGVDVYHFELDKKRFDWHDAFFVVEDIFVPIYSINHKSSVDKISLSFESQNLNIEGVALTPFDQSTKNYINTLTGINEINISGVDFRMLKDIHQLDADNIDFKGVRGVIAVDDRLKPDTTSTEKKPKKAQKEFLKYLNIGDINLEIDDFAFLHTDTKGRESYLTFFGGEFNINKLKSTASANKEIGKIRPDHVYVKMKGLQYERDISPYVISSTQLVADSKGDSLIISDASIVPKLGHQSVDITDSLFLFQVDEFRVKGAGLKSLAYDKIVDIDTIYAKNINYINPSKTKKVKKVGTFAQKNFPKEKVEELLTKMNSFSIKYIEVENSAVSFRSVAQNVKRKNISRLMRRQRTATPLNNTALSPKEINKYSKKTNRIKNNKRMSQEKKEALINDILAETKGNPIDVYTLNATEDSMERIEHQKAFMSIYNENTIKDINLKIDGIAINQETIQSERNYIDLGRIDLTLGKNIFNLNNGMYAIGFDSLNFNSHYADIDLKKFQLIPRYSKKLFGIVNEYQTDRIEITIDDLLLRGFHFQKYFFTDSIHLNGVEVDRLDLSAYRDKTVPIDPNKKNPKMIHTILEDLPLSMNLDTITITDSHIDYEEYKGNIRSNNEDQELAGKSGQFQLNDFTGQIFNISNDTSKLNDKPFIEMYVKGILMDEGGQLKMYFRIPPLDSLGTYYYEGEVGKMDLVKLNPLVERLELVKIKDGRLKRMYFKVLADDTLAVGNMQFRYKNLEVDVLKDKAKKTGELKRRAFLSSVANLLIREENPRFPSMKQGHIYFERDQSKFIFNYWVKTVLTGIASTLSPLMEPDIPKKDKESKMEIRYIEKNTKRKNRINGPLKRVY